MHFIQNNWIAQNWTFFLCLGLLGMATIGYLHNRAKLMKLSLASALGVAMLTLSLSIHQINVIQSISITEMTQQVQANSPSPEGGSVLSNIFSFGLDMLKEKIND